MQMIERVYTHAHLFCGIGAGAKGFNQAEPRIGHLMGRFRCLGGIDVDAGAIAEFERQTGVKGTVRDLFNREQYVAFHGHQPPADWIEASPADLHAAFGPTTPDVVFTSAPCKGFSGLLSSSQSKTDKYQALNALTLRGVWLMLEAYKNDPVPIVLFENVPRIASRGRKLLDQIIGLLRSYGYNVNEDAHDCGELGGLAQSRKRFLLIARHPVKVPPFVYQPPKMRLRGVGEVIGKLPLPGDPVGGVMHRVPALQWRTWVRLAFVPAGKDWRALNDLRVEGGVLADYGIMPEHPMRDNALGVMGWDETAGVVVGNQRSPLHGRHSVADPRPTHGPSAHQNKHKVVGFDEPAPVVTGSDRVGSGALSVADPRTPEMQDTNLGVHAWDGTTGVIGGRGGPTNGAYSVADPRHPNHPHHGTYGVKGWQDPAGVIGGAARPANGPHAVADPRPGYPDGTHQNILSVQSYDAPGKSITGGKHPAGGALAVADPRVENGHPKSVQLGVRKWDQPAACVKGDVSVGTGPYAVSDPRLEGKPRFNNTFRIVPYDGASPAVAGPGGPAGGIAVADPRAGEKDYVTTKYKVTHFDEASRAVIGASTTGDGAFAVADPRSGIGEGGQREHYQTGGHYGVVPWTDTGYCVSGSARHDNGWNNVADPRDAVLESEPFELPKPDDRLICRIVALDETWHRPFTTLELAALQSIVDPEEVFGQDPDGLWFAREGFAIQSRSDATRREWIGNAVPSAAARAMATTIGETLLLAGMGESFTLSTRAIWVKPLALALAVDNDQLAFRMEAE